MKNSFLIENLVRENIRILKPYSSARNESKVKNGLFLDANESPYNTGYNRYPQPVNMELKSAAARMAGFGMDCSNVFAGNGSDEAIDVLVRIFCNPGKDNIVSISPTYGMYKVVAAINDVEYRECRLGEGFSLDGDALLSLTDRSSKIIFLCSPNNPTGNLLERSEVMKVVQNFAGIVVIDEAYIDFSGDKGYAGVLKVYPNVVILRTMSKSRGMAGIRVGFAFASSEIISYMDKVKYPYNLNAVSQELAIKSLARDKMENLREIVNERERMFAELGKTEGVKRVFPGKGNFLLAEVGDPAAMVAFLKSKGVVIRDRSKEPGCEGCVRITVGKRSENDLLLSLLNGGGEQLFADSVRLSRITRETTINLALYPGRSDIRDIRTGIGFFDHMLELFALHSGLGMDLCVSGDLEVDGHHTIEDTAIVLGEAVATIYRSRGGYNRYGFVLPMDESRAEVLVDLGGRSGFKWDVSFKDNFTGDFPVQMYPHFFESLASAGKFTLHMNASGSNDHHIAEALFKAFARAIRIALSNDIGEYEMPSSKGLI